VKQTKAKETIYKLKTTTSPISTTDAYSFLQGLNCVRKKNILAQVSSDRSGTKLNDYISNYGNARLRPRHYPPRIDSLFIPKGDQNYYIYTGANKE